MNIYILGHTGFFGKNIFKILNSRKNYNVFGISSETIDLSETNSLSVLQNILLPDSIIIMCIGVKKQLGDDIEVFEKNMKIINNFCKAVSNISTKKIIYFSSAAVYGEDVDYHEKITEKTSAQPKSYYGIAKLMAEYMLEKQCKDTKTQLTILRPPLVYGKDDLSRGYGPTGFVYKALDNEKIILWGDGTEFREFISIDDLAKVVSRLIDIEFEGILNLVSGKSHTYSEIVNILKEKIKIGVNVELKKRTKEKVDHHYSNRLIRNILGEFKFTDLESGIKKLCHSIQNC